MAVSRDKLATTEENSIIIGLPELSKGEKTSVIYSGLLSKKGADKVYLHYGFDGWNNVNTIAMSEAQNGVYTAKLKVDGDREINFCFKDDANNWDNNYGINWKTEIVQ